MELTGPEKAVLMLLSLDEAVAGPIVAEFDASELRKLREVAALMRSVPAAALHDVYAEFVERGKNLVAVPHGGISYLRRLAASALGESRSEEILDAPAGGLERIAKASSDTVAAVLANEHPQVAAAILSQLEPLHAVRVFELLPPEAQTPVLLRLSTLTEVPAGLLETVAAAFADDLPASDTEAAISVDGIARAAALVRRLGKERSGEMLARITEENADIAAEIRQAMFTFEDLIKVDVRSIRAILSEVPSDVLVLALKTASEALKEHLLSCMSQRAAELIRDDLEALGAVRLAEVEAAQRQIVEAALRLEAGGAISLGQEEDSVV